MKETEGGWQSALIFGAYVGGEQVFLCNLLRDEARIVICILVITDQDAADAGLLHLQHLVSGIVRVSARTSIVN